MDDLFLEPDASKFPRTRDRDRVPNLKGVQKMPKFIKNLAKVKEAMKKVKDKAVLAAFKEVEKHRAAIKKEYDDLLQVVFAIRTDMEANYEYAIKQGQAGDVEGVVESLGRWGVLHKHAVKVGKKAAEIKKQAAKLEKLEATILKAASKEAALKAVLS